MPAEHRAVHRDHVGLAELGEIEEVATMAPGEGVRAQAEVAPARAAGAAAMGEDHRWPLIRPIDLAVMQAHSVHADEAAMGIPGHRPILKEPARHCAGPFVGLNGLL
ncbi:hypothetical protein D9M71_747990 [compost metagenome]